ncbi:MAG: DUF3347 domain-containing protein [Chitinophagaceae bacterium]|nr:MAG: DUF3347 domain-containing protein [Chitinophagaceae bacterium]
MKIIVFSIAAAAIVLSACDSNTNNAKAVNKTADTATANTTAGNAPQLQNACVDEVVNAYLRLKNALTADNGNDAATAGKQLHEVMMILDNASFPADQKKVYDDVKEDIKEHALHISTNAQKIAHQREHFDMLSKDMIDLVKVVKPSQALYRDHCPMYNDNKGADWLSEVKEIKNPYLGKKMPDCGEVKEEIKK